MRWLHGITDSVDMGFEQTQEDSEGQESLVCCSSWGCKESHTTEQLNNDNPTYDPGIPVHLEPTEQQKTYNHRLHLTNSITAWGCCPDGARLLV